MSSYLNCKYVTKPSTIFNISSQGDWARVATKLEQNLASLIIITLKIQWCSLAYLSGQFAMT